MDETPTQQVMNGFAEACRAANVQLVSCDKGGLDTTSADGEFQFTLFLSLARLEVRRLQERTLAGLATARANGHHLGRAPYGWRIDEDKKLVKDRQQQATLRQAANRRPRRTPTPV